LNQGNDIRVSGTVSAADVTATTTSLRASDEHRLALVASSPHTLTGLAVNKVLSTSLAWSGKDQALLRTIVPVRDDGSILLVGLDDRSTALPGGGKLGLCSLGWVTDTLGAANVLAVGALLGVGKGGAALVASTANAHPDRFVHAKDSLVG
jgi:hypothetical protein